LYKVVAPGLLDSLSNEVIMNVSKLVPLFPEVETDRAKIVKYVYAEIAGLCNEYNSKMIILMLRFRYWPRNAANEELDILRNLKGVSIAEADSELDIGAMGSSFKKKYLHWYDYHVLDKHPNNTAHKIIADSIIHTIENESEG
jgi:hypothetical protein